MVAPFTRKRFEQAYALMQRDAGADKVAYLCQKWFDRCREEAIEEHFCIRQWARGAAVPIPPSS